MRGYNFEYATDNKDIYDEIKERLGKTMSTMSKEKKIFLSPLNIDVPGPGHYSLSETFSTLPTTKSIGFPKAKRFPNENHSAERQSTLEDSSKNYPTGFDTSNAFYHLESQKTLETTENQFKIQNQTSRSLNKTQLCSFSKAKRKLELNTGEFNEIGPGAYNVTVYSPTSRAGFSFGSKWNSLTRESDTPGPTTYRPEVVEIKANHLNAKGPVLSKAERKSSELRVILNRPPFGENYYKSSYYSSFSPKQSDVKKLIMGSGPKMALISKEKIDFPGPGAYEITGFSTSREKSDKKNVKNFPSFGTPGYSKKWFKEELPGPGEYNLSISDHHKGKIKIGTSKRPAFFDPKKQVEVILNEEKLKRLKRVEKFEKEKAERTKLKVNKQPGPVRTRKLYFDELVEKSEQGPGFAYNIDKYNKIGSNLGGSKIGKSERKFMKEIEDAKNIPGPGNYDIAKEDNIKQVSEVKFSTSKRQDNFVKKESYNIPGVGNYDLKDVSWIGKGGIISHSKKGLVDEKVEKIEKPETVYQFIDNLDQKLQEMIERERINIQNSPWF